MKIQFTKMHGCGNDYVYVNCFDYNIEDPNSLSIRISDRHFGIGSDGLVLIMPSESCDFRMRMFNADGSEAQMCGNASRCIAKYVYDHHLTDKTEFTLETLAGVKVLKVFPGKDGIVEKVTVNMGQPEYLPEQEIEVLGEKKRMTYVSMGNPHAVYFTEDVETLDLEKIGPAYENHPYFPNRTNSEFVKIYDKSHARMRVWERGSGETWACGTGSCATLVACVLNGLTDRQITLDLNGGSLDLFWSPEDNNVYMTGPATEVFEGEIEV